MYVCMYIYFTIYFTNSAAASKSPLIYIYIYVKYNLLILYSSFTHPLLILLLAAASKSPLIYILYSSFTCTLLILNVYCIFYSSFT